MKFSTSIDTSDGQVLSLNGVIQLPRSLNMATIVHKSALWSTPHVMGCLHGYFRNRPSEILPLSVLATDILHESSFVSSKLKQYFEYILEIWYTNIYGKGVGFKLYLNLFEFLVPLPYIYQCV